VAQDLCSNIIRTLWRLYVDSEGLIYLFTCNPKWVEIVSNLRKGEKVPDRPDLTARVFKLKLKNLLSDIIDKKIFGQVTAYCYSISEKFPHAHILVISAAECKLRDRSQIDQIISAEIPDPKTNPTLYQMVSQLMIHCPCGTLNMNSPCMDKKKCTKEFPKTFQAHSIENKNGYPWSFFLTYSLILFKKCFFLKLFRY
jgi:hypothetical protein